MPRSGYPTPDEQDGDVTFGCIPVVVPNNPEFNQLFAAAIYGLYASMSKPHFWRAFGTLTPELAAEYASRGLAQTDAYSECGDDCSGELLPTHSIVSFEPQDPHTEPDLVPDGYLLPPFWEFGGVLPEFIGDWFGGLIEEITGYNLTDVLVTIGSFPILAGWDELITSSLPRIDIAVTGAGTLELHLLAVPFGGRVLITLDEIPTMADIVLGLYNDSEYMVDTVLDITSIPPETVEEVIIEYTTDIDTPHVFTATFIPVVDDELIPLAFGGGLRSVVWCGATIPTEECPECPEELTIPEIIADDEYFVEEYVPVVFGEYYSETVSHYSTLLAAHDDTPQSVAPLVPVAAPGAIEDNALCYAINRFVELYASQKTCLIQSQNFIETLWSDFANAANDFYNAATNLMAPFYSPNIFSCFVDDTAAIAALQDTAAIEELACFLFDELKAVAMSQSNFDDAILAAATDLTDEAQEIACLMQNDNSESLYISFLQGYNIALGRQYAANEDLECPCLTDTYWMWVIDFANGDAGFLPVISGGYEVATYTGSYWQNRTTNPPNIAWCAILKNFDRPYIIKAAAVEFSAQGFAGGADAINIAVNVERNRAGTALTIVNSTGWNVNGDNQIKNGYLPSNPTATWSMVFNVLNHGAPSGSNYSHTHRVVIYGLPSSGIKPPGSVWVSAVPTSPNALFP